MYQVLFNNLCQSSWTRGGSAVCVCQGGDWPEVQNDGFVCQQMSFIHMPPQQFGINPQKAPRNPGKVSPTHALGNRHTEVSPICSSCSVPWTDSIPYWSWSRALEDSFLDSWTREFLWILRSPVEKFQHTTGAKNIYEFGCIGEGKKNSSTWLVSPFFHGSTAQCQERLSQL